MSDLSLDAGSLAGTRCPHCAGEQARRYRPGAPEQRVEITSPEAAADVLTPLLEGLDREHCVTLNLDTKHRLLAATTISIGSVDHTFMSPREVFRDALLHGASAIVLAQTPPATPPPPATTRPSQPASARPATCSASRSSTTWSSGTTAGPRSPDGAS